ncbi:hypothetical protein AVEN_221046-1 [Araneus ventricosus]|uniref:Uncharacterized protein n=1 Tax=Araneus ventricosus TaxID=182803 RepID=A0A4Y2USQ5_ARAVE|nr:hypothetical protein AVEN_29600-1 [Araneus ventricosus]GBO14728.1 hypothetical protein AVEN_221046-1 [Araneus ventricosus]
MKTYGKDSDFYFALVPTTAVMQFSLDKQTEKTVSILAFRDQKLLVTPSVIVPSAYGTLMPVDDLPSDGIQQKCDVGFCLRYAYAIR